MQGEKARLVVSGVVLLCIYIGLIWVFNYFCIIFYYIQNCEYREKLSFKIMFGWFGESEIKFEK
jgi:NADH:ubiquinone oxidoreductase subunit 6 (subunit J)